MRPNNKIVIISVLLISTIFMYGCEGIVTTDKPTDNCIATGFVNRTDVEDLLVKANNFVDVNNLCRGQDIPHFEYRLLYDQETLCGQKGYIPVDKANEIVDSTNRYIDVANLCTGGVNYAPLEHLTLFKNWASG